MDYSYHSLEQIYQIILDRGLDPDLLTDNDIRDFVDEYRQSFQLIRDIQNIHHRKGIKKSRKSGKAGNRKSTFEAAQVLSTIIVKR